MTFVIAAHGIVGLLVLVAASRLGRAAFAIGALPLSGALVYGVLHLNDVIDGSALTERTGWVGSLDLEVSLRIDAFSLLMVLVISGIGLAVMAYAASYFHAGPRPARTAGLLVLFAGAMLGVVTADNVAALYVAWELTSVTSFLLIGLHHERAEARGAALHALLVTGAGGLALLGGLVLLAQEAGTWSLTGILADAPTGSVAGAALALIVVGIVTKSAQYPTHAWLPSAMVAPTPISAYLHSATMVKAGIYLAARFAPAFALVGAWRPAVVGIGALTMIAGGLRAVRQHDLKLLLAMGTVSQLGLLLVLFGAGLPEATVAGVALLIAHALFKSTLFLVVGIIDHQAGTRDRRELSGFGRGWTPLKVVTAVAAASMAGLPPAIGFVSKEAAFEAFSHDRSWIFVLAMIVVGSTLTVVYTVRFAVTVLRRPVDARSSPPAPGSLFLAPAAVLAALTLAFGVGVGGLVDPLASAAAVALDPAAGKLHLALWHGLGLPLLLSAVALGTGLALVALAVPFDRLLERLALPWSGADGYAATVRGLNRLARRTTGVVQNGSLPVYVAVILMTAVVVPASGLLSAPWPGWPSVAHTPGQGLLAAAIVLAAIGAATANRRFVAVVLLGGVGYSMGLLFVFQGAPDLALTQFAIETLLLVAFVLVLRFLPAQFERQRPAVATWTRLAVATAVAVTVFFFALLSAGSRVDSPVGPDLIDRALPEAGGRNVVNVVLVDFRGLDTLGEISVLATAALGVVALARVRRSDTGAPREDQP